MWRSCAAYDQGHIDEAVRIATLIRVLIHDTRNSISLLKHLDALGINLSSTVSTMDRTRAVFLFGMGRVAGDALLYLGPAASLTQAPLSPDLYVDEDVRKEISRRLMLKGGGPLTWPSVGDNVMSPHFIRAYGKPDGNQ